MATKIKSIYNGDMRRVKLSEKTYEALTAGIRKTYSLNTDAEFKMTYKDEEGDTIGICDDDDFMEAIEESGKMLKVFVEASGSGSGSGSVSMSQNSSTASAPKMVVQPQQPLSPAQQMPVRGQNNMRYAAPVHPSRSHNINRRAMQQQPPSGGQTDSQNQSPGRRKLNPKAAGFHPISPGHSAQVGPAPYGNYGGQPMQKTWPEQQQGRGRGNDVPPTLPSPELLADQPPNMPFNEFLQVNEFLQFADPCLQFRTWPGSVNQGPTPKLPPLMDDDNMQWQKMNNHAQDQMRNQMRIHSQNGRDHNQGFKQNRRSMSPNFAEAFYGNQYNGMGNNGLPSHFGGKMHQHPKKHSKKERRDRGGHRGGGSMDWEKPGWHPGLKSMGVFADSNTADLEVARQYSDRGRNNGNKKKGGGRNMGNGHDGAGKKNSKKRNKSTWQGVQADTSNMTGKQRRQMRRRNDKEPIKWKAQIVKHITLKDRSTQAPGQILEKVWLMKNVGSQMWQNVQLICVKEDSDNPMNLEDAYPIPKCHAGREVEVKAYIQVPTKEGRHCSYYRLCNQNGRKFGPRIWADIISGYKEDTVMQRPAETDTRGNETQTTVEPDDGAANNDASDQGLDAEEYIMDNTLDVRQYLKNAAAAHENAHMKQMGAAADAMTMPQQVVSSQPSSI